MIQAMKDYAAPIVALDKVVWLDRARIVSRKVITGSEAVFEGHYPGYPIYPGVFIIEAVHQSVRHYAAKYHHDSIRLTDVCSTRFLSPLHPGDALEVDCEFTLQPDSSTLLSKAFCSSQNRKIAEIKLKYSLEKNHE